MYFIGLLWLSWC